MISACVCVHVFVKLAFQKHDVVEQYFAAVSLDALLLRTILQAFDIVCPAPWHTWRADNLIHNGMGKLNQMHHISSCIWDATHLKGVVGVGGVYRPTS